MSAAVQHESVIAQSRTTVAEPISSVGSKRKRMAEPKFYAVRFGNTPGIYHSYPECLEQVKGFKKASCKQFTTDVESLLNTISKVKSFTTLTEAEDFLQNGLFGGAANSLIGPQKFYAVRSGRVPGIYMDWPTAQQQIVGWTKPKHKAFPTRAEAEAFLQDVGSVNAGIDNMNQNGVNEESKKKKQRKSAVKSEVGNAEADEDLEPGTGPMPPVSEDGFDPKIILKDSNTGEVEYKTEKQFNATKMQAKGPADGAMLRIYTDGSALGNGQAGAVAGIGVYFGPADPRNLSEAVVGPRQTNQRAELTAVQRAIDIAPRDRDITIYSDSNYAIKCVTEWFPNWRRNGWLNSNKKPVENKDLIDTIVHKIDERKRLLVETKFQWLKGHANDPGNVAADALAVSGAQNARVSGT